MHENVNLYMTILKTILNIIENEDFTLFSGKRDYSYPPDNMLSVGPKMDGGPNIKYFESPETLTALESVKNWLQKNGKKVCGI